LTPASTLTVLTDLGISVTVRDGDLVLTGAALKELKPEDVESVRAMKGNIIALLRPPPDVPLALIAQARHMLSGRPDLTRRELIDALLPFPDQRRAEPLWGFLEAQGLPVPKEGA
jgi:hypothetical protein